MEATKHINYESDFSVLICLKGGRPTYPWTLVFTTNPRFSGSRYVVTFDGVNYTNCQPLEGTADFVRVEFNSHGLGAGMLTYKFYEATPDAAFSDGKRNTVRPVELPIQLWDAPSDDAALPPEIIVILQSLIKGLSAYEVDVKNGFVGTEAEWLKSLHADADKVAADLLLETKTRVAADQSFAAKQAEEERARVAADQALTTEVGKKATPQQITDAVAAEIAARIAADQELEATAEQKMNTKDTATLTAAKEFATTADTATLRDAKAFTTSEIAKIPTPDVSGQIATHNSATTSHADIRELIPTKTSQLTNDAKFLTSEVDPTVPAWAKNPTKPVYTASEVGAEPVQVVETIAAATATLNVIGGHTYLCGEMTSLTLATVENAPREAVIRFASGATATTLSLPATLKVVGYAKPAANQSYEISIRQGAAVIVNF